MMVYPCTSSTTLQVTILSFGINNILILYIAYHYYHTTHQRTNIYSYTHILHLVASYYRYTFSSFVVTLVAHCLFVGHCCSLFVVSLLLCLVPGLQYIIHNAFNLIINCILRKTYVHTFDFIPHLRGSASSKESCTSSHQPVSFNQTIATNQQ
jgi:hypothetical protein